jgi:bacterioferritin
MAKTKPFVSERTTRRILAMEEEHAEDMSTLLEQLGKKGEPAKSSPTRKAAGKRH